MYLFQTIGLYLQNCPYVYTFFLEKENLRYAYTRLLDGQEVQRA